MNIRSTEWQNSPWASAHWDNATAAAPTSLPNGRKIAFILALNSGLWSAVIVAAWFAGHH